MSSTSPTAASAAAAAAAVKRSVTSTAGQLFLFFFCHFALCGNLALHFLVVTH